MTILEQLAKELAAAGQPGFKHTTGGVSMPTDTLDYMGPNSLFGVAGLERDVISTRVQPQSLGDRLPAFGVNLMHPYFAYLTGFQAGEGANKDGVCDDPPTAGPGKSCVQTAQFGRYEFQTRTMEINALGQRFAGETLDLRLLNDPLVGGEGLGFFTPESSRIGQTQFRREVVMRFLEVGIQFQNTLAQQVYAGNPTNNSAGGGYREFPGLDILINTGKIDAFTQTSCPSLNSDIRNFNFTRVDAPTADIVETLTYQMRDLKHIATRTNMNPVSWVIAMRRELFYELTALWPCSYLTYRCTFRAGMDDARINVDARDQVDFRDSMRNGMYLLIDGTRYPVVLDDGIVEETNTTNANVTSGCFASDIYIIPISVRGGLAATYWEYFDFQGNFAAMEGAIEGRLTNEFWTDGGRFLWHPKPPVNWCVQWLAKMEPRIILKTPHLAGRLLNVEYCPLSHTRDPFNDDPYFVNGGVTTGREGPSLFSEWGSVR